MRTNTRFGSGVRSGLLFAALVAAGGCGGPLDVEDDGTPPEGGGDVGTPAEGVVSSALTSQTVNGTWSCPSGQSCEDGYDVAVGNANTLVTMRITSISGSSVLRLGAYGPNSLNTNNLLTSTQQAWICPAGGTGRDVTQSVSFRAPAAGTYRLILGRDAIRSAGTSGSYTVAFEGDPAIGTATRITNDRAATGLGFMCGYQLLVNNAWSCQDRGCQNIYDFDVQANTVLKPNTGAPSGNSAVRLAIFGPGTPVSGPNLLTGRSLDRQCVGVGVGDSTRLLARTAGRYRIAIGRDQTLSTGNSGAMTVGFAADKPLLFLGQTVANGATGETGAACGFQFVQIRGDWICPSGTTCQDVYDFDAEPSTAITAKVDLVTGGSRVRLALFNQGDALHTTNLFNGLLSDRACVGANTTDSATSSRAFNLMRLAVGRDGGSAGTSGSYRVTVTTTNTPLAVFGQTANNIPTQLPTSSCP